jgi:hypothetical protein
VLRTAAYLITATTPGTTRRLPRHALARALADLAAELARLRHAQQRLRQATAARNAAATLTAASHTPALDPDGLAPPIPLAAARTRPAARRRPTAGRGEYPLGPAPADEPPPAMTDRPAGEQRIPRSRRSSARPPAGQDLRAWAAALAATLPPLTEPQVAVVARLAAHLDAEDTEEQAV